jgi:heterodisulfide reductase subunit B
MIKMDVAYFPGCTLHASSKTYDVQTKLVMENLGMTLRELEDWNCCGATSACKTSDFLAVAMPARNLAIADSMGLEKMIIPCSGCYNRMLTARKKMDSDPLLREQINGELKKKITGKTEIVSILEVLLESVRTGILKKQISKSLSGLRAACYYGCMQTRFAEDIPVSDDVENPQSMESIMETLGAEVLDWNSKTDCCSASASVNDPDISNPLMAAILEDALARDVHCLVTSCPMCQLNLDAYQGRVRKKYGIEKEIPVYFITEMVGLAMGKNISQLQIDRHLVDSVGLLKELGLS